MRRCKGPSVSGGGSGGGYRFKITIDHTKVGSGAVSNFLFMFTEEIANIPIDFWSHIINPSGLDIRFLDTDESTELSREIVSVDTTAKTLEAWIQIPSGVNQTTDKIIWCYYGGGTTPNSASIWDDSFYTQVNHFQVSGVYTQDSAHNVAGELKGNPGSIVSIDGKIHKAIEIAGTNGRIQIPNSGYINFGNSVFSLSLWSTIENSDTLAPIVQKSSGLWSMNICGADSFYDAGKRIGMYIADSTFTTVWGARTNNDIVDGAIHRLCISADSSNKEILFYVDGIAVPSTMDHSEALWPDITDTTVEIIGGATSPQKYDEFRIRKAITDPVEEKTEFANQNDPATFADCDTEEIVSGGSPGFRPGQIRGPCS